MKHLVRLFGPARDAAGAAEVEVEAATVAELLAALGERYPSLREILAVSAVAVNCEYAQPDQPLAAGDEIAVIPPVSGG
jgi:molybdopterin converting factor subunit 1